MPPGGRHAGRCSGALGVASPPTRRGTPGRSLDSSLRAHLLRHPAHRPQAPRQLHRRRAPVRRRPGPRRPGDLLHRGPARDHGPVRARGAARARLRHDRDPHRRGPRSRPVRPLPSVRRPRAHRAVLAPVVRDRHRRAQPHAPVPRQVARPARARLLGAALLPGAAGGRRARLSRPRGARGRGPARAPRAHARRRAALQRPVRRGPPRRPGAPDPRGRRADHGPPGADAEDVDDGRQRGGDGARPRRADDDREEDQARRDRLGLGDPPGRRQAGRQQSDRRPRGRPRRVARGGRGGHGVGPRLRRSEGRGRRGGRRHARPGPRALRPDPARPGSPRGDPRAGGGQGARDGFGDARRRARGHGLRRDAAVDSVTSPVRRLVLLVGAIVLVDTMFYAAITPLLPKLADDLDLGKNGAGVLTGAYAAGTLLGSLPAGALIARTGVKPTVLLGLVLMSVAGLAFAFADSIEVLDAARFVQGIGGACTWSGGMAWIAAEAPRERRGELLGGAMGAAIFGVQLGPVIGALATAVGQERTFSSPVLFGVALAFWAWRTPARTAAEDAPATAGPALRNRSMLAGMWLTALPAAAFGVLDVLAPLRLAALGAGALALGATFFAAAGLEALISPLVGRSADRGGGPRVVRRALAATPAALVAIQLPGTALVLAVGVVALSGLLGVLWVPAMGLLTGGAERIGLDHGFAFAYFNLAWAAGFSLGAFAGGTLAEVTSDAAAYAGVATLYAISALYALLGGRGGGTVAESTELARG